MLSSLLLAIWSVIDPKKWHFPRQCWHMLQVNWYLGLTSFGGLAVHFQTFHKLYVEKLNWISEQMFYEMFALCQALPGAASTKMLLGVNLMQFGFTAGILSFFIWSLPGAIVAYGLAVGVAHINQKLPEPVYAALSGLNAATVGIVLLAAVQLSQKGITDTLSRVLVFLAAAAGLLYNSLWYFPVLMIGGGIAAVVSDYRFVHRAVLSVRACLPGRRTVSAAPAEEEGQITDITGSNTNIPLGRLSSDSRAERRTASNASMRNSEAHDEGPNEESEEHAQRNAPEALNMKLFSWKAGVGILIAFFAVFIAIMTLRETLDSTSTSRAFELFANLFLAGTIIFGGGPVVIPLLREYVVAEGWVPARDFLLGLAIIQAFPGPNFNFAVYLGALAVNGTSIPSIFGAILAYLGIYAPGLILHVGTMSIWHTLRSRRWFKSCLRGVNAAAIGLVYTAVYRIWRIGYLDVADDSGSSLDVDPWWVVITATSFFGGMWFDLKAPYAVMLGGTMGLIWYGVNKG